jgi:hypothetical protein
MLNLVPGPEPLEGFYLAVVNQEMVLLLGDLKKEAYRRLTLKPVDSNAIFIAKREHIFGKKFYGASSIL